MIKTKIQFNCTWPKEDVQKLFDKLINASGITELGLSMVLIQDAQQQQEEEEEEVLQGPSDMATVWDREMFDNPVDDPNSEIVKVVGRTADSITFASGESEATIKLKPTDQATESQKEQIEEKPKSNMFTEIEPITKDELGTLKKTQKPIITYAETQDGRVAIYYNEAPMYSTMAAIRALPDKVTNAMVKSMPAGKRAALRGFKKYITELDKHDNKILENSDSDEELINGVDPYAPILTGGAKVDTHASGKIGDEA